MILNISLISSLVLLFPSLIVLQMVKQCIVYSFKRYIRLSFILQKPLIVFIINFINMKMEYMETLACVTIPVQPSLWRREYRFYLVVSQRFRVFPIQFIVPCNNMRVAWRLLKSYLKNYNYKLEEFHSVTTGGRIYTKIK